MRKILCIMFLILMVSSCEKEKESVLDCSVDLQKVIYYPNKHISITFQIMPFGDQGPFTIKWYEPDTLKSTGPYTLTITGDLLLDFGILDAQNLSKRITKIIRTDSVDSLLCDYRNDYIGQYGCNVSSTYNGSTHYFKDTILVVKNSTFCQVNILTKNDVAQGYEGNVMTYLNGNNIYFPPGNFYGYHSGAEFKNDSIFYTVSGPLGYYYTNVYKGKKIH